MKISAIIIALIISTITLGQTNNAVFLRWKIKPKEVLTYKTVMEEINTSNSQDSSVGFGELFNLLNDSANKSLGDNDLITNMTLTNRGLIDIAMSTKDNDSKLSKGGVAVRGAIYDNGSIQSFYVKSEQRNLIAIFFELPNKQIKIGDSWPLDINLISMDEAFKCDTASKKNNVTLVDLKKVGNETIAVVKYDIEEYVSGDFDRPLVGANKKIMMKMKYRAIAEFSIDKGRWSSYHGIMSMSASGIMTTDVTKKFALIIQ